MLPDLSGLAAENVQARLRMVALMALSNAGGEMLHACPCLNDHPAWIEAMRTIVSDGGRAAASVHRFAAARGVVAPASPLLHLYANARVLRSLGYTRVHALDIGHRLDPDARVGWRRRDVEGCRHRGRHQSLLCAT